MVRSIFVILYILPCNCLLYAVDATEFSIHHNLHLLSCQLHAKPVYRLHYWDLAPSPQLSNPPTILCSPSHLTVVVVFSHVAKSM